MCPDVLINVPVLWINTQGEWVDQRADTAAVTAEQRRDVALSAIYIDDGYGWCHRGGNVQISGYLYSNVHNNHIMIFW